MGISFEVGVVVVVKGPENVGRLDPNFPLPSPSHIHPWRLLMGAMGSGRLGDSRRLVLWWWILQAVLLILWGLWAHSLLFQRMRYGEATPVDAIWKAERGYRWCVWPLWETLANPVSNHCYVAWLMRKDRLGGLWHI